jgi:hypothetical protein
VSSRAGFATAAALVAITLAGCGSGTASSAPLYVSARGSDGGACTKARPCRSFDDAYRSARPGAVVLVKGGFYGRQTISQASGGRSGKRVVFRAAPKAKVRLSYLDVYGKHVEFQRMRTNGWYVHPGAHDVVFRSIRTTNSFYIVSASKVSVIGGSVGPGHDKAPQIKACNGCTTPPTDILVSGVRFHDWTKRTAGAHVDCLHVMAVDGLVVRGSRFRNCEHFDILFTRYGSAGTPTNVRIENNFLSCCRSGYYSLSLGGGHDETYRNFLIRNNSTDQAMSVCDDCTLAGNILFLSNVAPGIAGCDGRGVRGDYNVLAHGPRCGPHSKIAPSGFVDPVRMDFRLEKGAAAIDAGDPDSYPRRDIFSRRRPRGKAPDAGAYEAA